MSLGHDYAAIFRVTPIAGPVYTVDAAIIPFLTVAQPTYDQVIGEKEFIDRSIGLTRYGFRVSVTMEFQMQTPSIFETALCFGLFKDAMRDLSTVELSLDGGTVYREVVMTDFRQQPMAGKNIGVIQSMTWVCKDLIEEKPAIGSGSW